MEKKKEKNFGKVILPVLTVKEKKIRLQSYMLPVLPESS